MINLLKILKTIQTLRVGISLSGTCPDRSRRRRGARGEVALCAGIPLTLALKLQRRRMKGARGMLYVSCMISLLLISCGKQKLNPLEYVKWVENESNGLHVKKSIGDYEFSVQYKPVEYLVAQDLKEMQIETVKMEKEKQELGNLQYFTLSIKPKEGADDVFKYKITSQEEYYSRVQFFSYDVLQYVKLVDGNDTLNCVLNHLERNYNVSTQVNLLLAFEPSPGKENKTNDKIFIYDDPVLGEGKIQLTVASEKIEKLPKIKTI